MGKIVSLGEVVADIYRDSEGTGMRMPFTARPGGSPANKAVAVARLGTESAFIGAVGEDLFGDFILRALEGEGVDVRGVVRQKAPTRTSIAFVELSETGDREFTFYRSDPAADELLDADDVRPEVLEGASFLNFGSIPLIREPVRSATHRAVELAGELSVPVAFDVNFREHLWHSIEEAKGAIDPLVERSQVVKLSEEELVPLLGTQSAEEAAEMLLGRGVSLVLVSAGEKGSFYATRDFSGTIPAYEVEAVDTTGAGDAFFATVLAHLCEAEASDGWSEDLVREAARLGCAAGAIICTGYGGMEALPNRETLERFLVSADEAWERRW
jgi:fructokinase